MAYQIPPEIAHFVDREPEQAVAVQAAADWAEPSRPLCFAVSGLAGTGRTELAYRIARRLRHGPQDDVLYVDLDDLRRDGAVEIADVLGELMLSLGALPGALAPTAAGRRRQYWTLTDARRLIVVVDNARYESEVVPLLPASGAGVLIVVSHGPLRDLAAGTAIGIALDPLTDEFAEQLLSGVDADPRLAAEPEAVADLIRLCSGLPAALHVAARWIRRHHLRPLSRLCTELTAELHGKGLPMVEDLWDTAYRSLGPDGAELYRLLAGTPGWWFTPESAAAILGRGAECARDALEELEGAGLLEARNGRRRVPELLSGHARRRADRDDTEGALAQGQRRIVRWYARQAQRADAIAAGARLLVAGAVPASPGAPDVEFEDKSRALRWLESERHALYGCVRLGHGLGLDAETVALCEPLWTHFLDHRHYADVIEAFGTGVASALRAGDVAAIARMRCQLARPLWEQGDFEEAGREVERALNAIALLGDSDAERRLGASAVEFRGTLAAARGDWAAAVTDFDASLRVHREIGNTYGVALMTYRSGAAVAELGEPERAAALLARAHTMAGDLGRERLTARTGFALGTVLQRLGRVDEARELYTRALASARSRGADDDEVRVLDALAGAAEHDGDASRAHEHREAARVIRERHGGIV